MVVSVLTEVEDTHWVPTDVVDMAALLPCWRPVGILMLMKARQLASFNVLDLGVFNPEGVVVGLWHYRRVDDCNSFW